MVDGRLMLDCIHKHTDRHALTGQSSLSVVQSPFTLEIIGSDNPAAIEFHVNTPVQQQRGVFAAVDAVLFEFFNRRVVHVQHGGSFMHDPPARARWAQWIRIRF